MNDKLTLLEQKIMQLEQSIDRLEKRTDHNEEDITVLRDEVQQIKMIINEIKLTTKNTNDKLDDTNKKIDKLADQNYEQLKQLTSTLTELVKQDSKHTQWVNKQIIGWLVGGSGVVAIIIEIISKLFN